MGMACLQGNNSEFVDTTGRERRLLASRFAGTCSVDPAVNLLTLDLNQAERVPQVSKSGCTLL